MEPELIEDTRLDQVTLKLKTISPQEVQSAESAEYLLEKDDNLSDRHKQILSLMAKETEYSTEEIAKFIGLKSPRTRQLLNELVDMGKLTTTAVTKNRRYIKKQ